MVPVRKVRKKPATFILWKWDNGKTMTAYTADHVNQMARQIRNAMHGRAHRVFCITDNPDGIVECETYPLWSDCNTLINATKAHLPSCYRRLKLYDPDTQAAMGISKGERIVSIDLDACVCLPLAPIVDHAARFVGWELPGTHHPRVFNGSLQSFDARDLDFVWKDFDPATSPRIAADAKYLGSDQAWLSYKLVPLDQMVGLTYPEVASWPLQEKVFGKHDARSILVFFHGRAKPWMPEVYQRTPWVLRHWRVDQEVSNAQV